MVRTKLAIAFLVVSFLGFLDSTYLTIKHYQGEVPPCSIIHGCEVVTTSKYSEIAGISVALLGALFYLAILLLAIGYIDSKKASVLKIICYLTPVGFVMSLWFLFVQAVLLKAYCQYCLFSAVTSTALFGMGMVTLWKERQKSSIPEIKNPPM